MSITEYFTDSYKDFIHEMVILSENVVKENVQTDKTVESPTIADSSVMLKSYTSLKIQQNTHRTQKW